MKVMFACIKKDFYEFIRPKKNILCTTILMTIASMILLATKIFPILLNQVALRYPNLISDPSALDGMFNKMFPADVKGSICILASDIGVFYTIVVALLCHSLLPTEIKEGCWIMPINAGIPIHHLIFSKCLVYSLGIAFPAFVIMNLYYIVASLYLENNIEWINVFTYSLILAYVIICIVILTILLSVLLNHSIIAALTIIVTIITAPDILNLFSIGKYFPTYLLTYIYSGQSNIRLLFIPFVESIMIIYIIYMFTINKKIKNEKCIKRA